MPLLIRLNKMKRLLLSLLIPALAWGQSVTLDSEWDTVKKRIDRATDWYSSVTAYATGGQANATVLADYYNYVSTVATAGDSVKVSALSTYSNGQPIVVYNAGAASLDVFPATGEDLGEGTDTAIAVLPNYFLVLQKLGGAWVSTLEQPGSGSVFIEKHAASHTLTAGECYGSVYYVTAASVVLTLPPAEDGMNITVISNTANVVTVDSDAADLIILDGTALDDGDSIDSAGAAGDVCVLTYYDATGWFASTNTWVDGGP